MCKDKQKYNFLSGICIFSKKTSSAVNVNHLIINEMKYFKGIIQAILFLIFISACNPPEEIFVASSDPAIMYSGRINHEWEDKARLYWSGSSVKINFKGNSIQALLKDEYGKNYYNILLDDDSAKLLRLDASKKFYLLAKDLDKGMHSLEIFKRNEWTEGSTDFFGFKISGDPEVLPASKPKKRKIEFYGNSITAGYGVEDYSGNDSPDSIYTNNYLSYACRTAKYFNADYSCICRSGIGISISWFPMIMPEMFNLLDPNDKESKWDFSDFKPDIVVINLLQNDSWLVNRPQMEVFKQRFGEKPPDDNFMISSYAQFIKNIRSVYPQTSIICILGNMDATAEGSKWPGIIEQAVEKLEDNKIYTHFIPYKDTPGHPKIEEQEVMALSLINFIEENISW